MCLLRRNYSKASRKAVHSFSTVKSGVMSNASNCKSGASSSSGATLQYPTRYFGRKSKTIPSRALKRRIMGPTRNHVEKQVVLRNLSSRNPEAPKVDTGQKATAVSHQNNVETAQGSHKAPPSQSSETSCKKRGLKMAASDPDFLTTPKAYFLSTYRTESNTSSREEIYVPSWDLKPIPSFYQMEGTENINDEVFHKRHCKHEQDERRRKRWDLQRLREERMMEKLQNRHQEQVKSIQRKSQSFYPSPNRLQSIEIINHLPVLAFGRPIPVFQPCEFSLPWVAEQPSTVKSEGTSSAKVKRGRLSSSQPKVT